MSTTSTNFNLVIATASDQVNVVTQIANNFSSLDSILSQVHTGTGQLKAGLNISNWTATNPTIVGTLTGGTIVATTGRFQTITATGGALTASTLAVGTYSFPTTVGTTGALLTVVTGNAVWVAPSGGTGANTGLSNLASVAINTSINTFTGGFATLDRVLATSGALTGLTVFQASTGTFVGNLGVTGTINANAINVTGGSITAGSFAIGTYSLPTTIGATGQILTVTTGNAQWISSLNAVDFNTSGSYSSQSSVSLSLALSSGAHYQFRFDGFNPQAGTVCQLGIRVNAVSATSSYYSVSHLSTTIGTSGYIPFSVSGTAGMPLNVGTASCVFHWEGVIGVVFDRVYVKHGGGVAIPISGSAGMRAETFTWVDLNTATSISLVELNSNTSVTGTYTLYKLRTS